MVICSILILSEKQDKKHHLSIYSSNNSVAHYVPWIVSNHMSINDVTLRDDRDKGKHLSQQMFSINARTKI